LRTGRFVFYEELYFPSFCKYNTIYFYVFQRNCVLPLFLRRANRCFFTETHGADEKSGEYDNIALLSMVDEAQTQMKTLKNTLFCLCLLAVTV
ncbi:MAG: hypothetical protein IIZ07_00185, partial [Ruminococcus sp.]|nr:hypothetical protein [Ruminococcus sp.]